MMLSARAVLPLLCGSLLGCLSLGCASKPPADETIPPAPVKWEPATNIELEEWVELVGVTQPLPERAARVTAAIDGQVLAVLPGVGDQRVVEGQLVTKGTVLVQLNASIIQANLAKLEATQKVYDEEQKQARLALELATNDVDRLARLKQDDDRRLEEALRNKSSVRPTPLVQLPEWQKANIMLQDAQSKLAAAGLKIEAGVKELEALKQQRQLYTLTAPVTGRLGRLQVAIGQSVAIGTVVADIVDVDKEIDALCFVPAAVVHQLKPGLAGRPGGFDKASSAGLDASAKGRVVFIADQAEADTGNYAVKVRFPNDKLQLRSNAVMRLRIATRQVQDSLTLPESAILDDQNPPVVMVVMDVKNIGTEEKPVEVGVVRRLKATLGIRDRVKGHVQILGLEDTETDPQKKWQGDLEHSFFITSGGHGLQNDDKVKLERDEDE